jgi:hypothetical protein
MPMQNTTKTIKPMISKIISTKCTQLPDEKQKKTSESKPNRSRNTRIPKGFFENHILSTSHPMIKKYNRECQSHAMWGRIGTWFGRRLRVLLGILLFNWWVGRGFSL